VAQGTSDQSSPGTIDKRSLSRLRNKTGRGGGTRSARESNSCPRRDDLPLHLATLPSKKSANSPATGNPSALHKYVYSGGYERQKAKELKIDMIPHRPFTIVTKSAMCRFLVSAPQRNMYASHNTTASHNGIRYHNGMGWQGDAEGRQTNLRNEKCPSSLMYAKSFASTAASATVVFPSAAG
jgi:hypothetical protein